MVRTDLDGDISRNSSFFLLFFVQCTLKNQGQSDARYTIHRISLHWDSVSHFFALKAFKSSFALVNACSNKYADDNSVMRQPDMDQLTNRMGFWSAVIIILLVVFIDVGMIASAILFPMSSMTSIEAYANSFSSFQMLPFIPSLLLAPMFVIMMLCIHYYAPQEKRVLSQLGFSFALICAAILSIHYYSQLTVVRQGLLNNELSGLWQFAAPNPYSFFWTFAALGYGFMGIALLSVAPIFKEKSENTVKWLFIANGLVGIAFLIGNALGVFIVNILSSFIWGVLFPIACILLAKEFRKRARSSIFISSFNPSETSQGV